MQNKINSDVVVLNDIICPNQINLVTLEAMYKVQFFAPTGGEKLYLPATL